MRTGANIRIGDLRRRRLTLPQAAQALGMDVGAVRKSVDRGWLTPTYMQIGGRRIRALDGIDIVCLIINHSVTAKVRNQVYSALKHWPEDRPVRGTVALQVDAPTGRRTIDVPLDRSVGEALDCIESLERSEEIIDPSNATIRGTSIEAHRIAALIDGDMRQDEVLRDYPNLTAAQVEAAVAYARANPKQGRPFPSRTVKYHLLNGKGGLERAFAAAREGE